ncbi:pyridoxal phosphate-dependent aminotransferase [Aquitalea aquatica]|uniref:Aminotransferase n=1 Tax=Aquitalea aquatica TaxID=3044273 RepID=A0A838Y5Q2_9NEIS|nr:aminotransferase class I/II-fold pyridoxal phosphate-dependent enzyme [Aquitalea magnusonii]MBA4710823.1 aminotransferase class I/II-fold pyridoxal phosphate-dependent enzyme [Aquitalea magnusonii]
MHYSSLVDRLAGKRTDAWQIHYAAQQAQARGEEVFILSVGDPDFATPASISERAVSALLAGDTHYSDVSGRPALRQALAAMHSEQTGQMVSEEQVIVVAGAQNGLFAVALCLCQPGDEVLVPEPMYLTYEASIRASGATLVPVAVDVERGFHLRPGALAAAITPRTRAIFLATPNNPSGAVMSRAELEEVAALAQQHDLWVVSDEVYAGLTFEQPHLSMVSLPGMAERTVTIGSLSKSHAMAGWRMGWVVAPAELVGHLGRLALCMLYGLPGFIQEAALLAVLQRDSIVPAMRETYRRRRDVCYRLLSNIPGLRCQLPEAGMFMLIDVRDSGLAAEDFAWRLFRQTGVAVLDASAFGDIASGFLRLGFVLDEARLAEACRRIASFVASLQVQPA